jgi:hypothetical protein
MHGPYHYLFYRDDLGRLRKKYVKRGSVEQKRAELEARKSADALLKQRLDALLPTKRTRNYDFMTGMGRSLRALDRLMGTAPEQGRDESGRFTKPWKLGEVGTKKKEKLAEVSDKKEQDWLINLFQFSHVTKCHRLGSIQFTKIHMKMAEGIEPPDLDRCNRMQQDFRVLRHFIKRARVPQFA